LQATKGDAVKKESKKDGEVEVDKEFGESKKKLSIQK
jgi:hypothetical protein